MSTSEKIETAFDDTASRVAMYANPMSFIALMLQEVALQLALLNEHLVATDAAVFGTPVPKRPNGRTV